MIGYRFMPLFKEIANPSENAYLKWTERHKPWGSSWKSTVAGSIVLEPRYVRGKLMWWYSNTMNGAERRWLVEFIDNGEPDFQLKQAMHAARWVEEHRKK